MDNGDDKLFRVSTAALVFFSIMLNITGNYIVFYFKIPVYLDTAGTILSAALGGFMPGVFVGFFSNVLNSFTHRNNLYYGIVSIFVGLFSVIISQKGGFRRLSRLPLYALPLSLGGVLLGNAITWGLLDGDWRDFTSSSAIWLAKAGMLSDGAAFFFTGAFVDYCDKLFSVAAAVGIIRLLPPSILDRLPLGGIYLDGNPSETGARVNICRRMSIRTKVGALMIGTYSVLGLVSAAIICYMYAELDISGYIRAKEMMALTLGSGRHAAANAFLARVLSLMFGTGMFLLSFSLWYVQSALVAPLRRMADAANQYLSQTGGAAGKKKLPQVNIRTGDEIEYLYEVLSAAAQKITQDLNLIRKGNNTIAQKNEIISTMQDHIIFCFASLVENRDDNTGGTSGARRNMSA